MSARFGLQPMNIGPADTGATRARIAEAWKGAVTNFKDQSQNLKQTEARAQENKAKGAAESANIAQAQTSQNMKDLAPGQSGGLKAYDKAGAPIQMGAEQHPNDIIGMEQMQTGLDASAAAPSPFVEPMVTPPIAPTVAPVINPTPSPLLTSDREQKKDIKSPDSIQELLDNLKPYSYKYKDPNLPGANGDENIGIMAQDLSKSKLGKEAIVEAPHGKMINTNKQVALAMAALAHLNSKVNKLEGKK